ncbi:MAG: tetratricopeptide repeat protein [Bacteroidales bacterium]|nr:tetratricopeptide repeat protein [Bacteroidales bacterium]
MRKFLFFIVCVALTVSLSAQSGKKMRRTASNSKEAVTERQISNRFNQGLRSFYTAQYEEAMQQFSGILSDAPKHAPSYIMLGRIYEEKKQYSEAENAFKQAIKLDKNNIWYQVELAKYYMHIADYKDALPYLEKICQKMPDSEVYLERLYMCYSICQMNEKAIEVHERLAKLTGETETVQESTPEIPDHENNKESGLKLLAEKNYTQAVLALEVALLQDDTDYDLWVAFAEATDKAQQWQKFTPYEVELTTLFPQSSALLTALAQAFLKTGNPEKAVEYFQQARAFAFDAELMQQIRKGLFNAYTAMGDTESAERYR